MTSLPEGAPMRSYKAFTLIELLVVISIIALLIAILLPALSKAVQSAKGVQCLSNLRGMGQASHGFAADNDGRFLPTSQYSPQVVEVPGTGLIEDEGDRDSWEGYLENYTVEDGSPSMYCPFFAGDPQHSWPSGWLDPDFGLYLMGYASFARPNLTGWQSAIDPPKRTDDTDSDVPIFSDIIEGRLDGGLWVYYSHSQGGSVGGGNINLGNTVAGPDGFNSAFADASASWTNFSPTSDEIEIVSGGFAQGFIWSYQSRP